jgi:hypothetical protein
VTRYPLTGIRTATTERQVALLEHAVGVPGERWPEDVEAATIRHVERGLGIELSVAG